MYKINYEKDAAVYLFNSLPAGEFFLQDGDLYLKLNLAILPAEYFNAVPGEYFNSDCRHFNSIRFGPKITYEFVSSDALITRVDVVMNVQRA